MTRKNEKTFQLIDNSAQLEYFYQEKIDIICGMELHKLTNLDTAYLQIKHLTSAAIYNLATRVCLSVDLYPVTCDDHKSAYNRKPHEFVFVGSQIAISKGNKTECVAHQHTPRGFAFRRVKCDSRCNFRWDSAALRIIGISEPNSATGATSQISCLALKFNTPDIIFFQDCNESELQKWVFGPPNTSALKRHSGKSPFLIQHHQFMEHQAVVNENILAAEIQSIYCGNLQMRKHLTMLLAESNGLAAARANNLPQCQRLKVLGDYFMIQQCASLNITVGIKIDQVWSLADIQKLYYRKRRFFVTPVSELFLEGRYNFSPRESVSMDRGKMDGNFSHCPSSDFASCSTFFGHRRRRCSIYQPSI